MVSIEIRGLIKQAVNELKIAEYELNRPNEDIVTVSVCLTARQCMNSLLRLFLLSRSINHNEGKSMQNLLDQCKKIDSQFATVDVSKIACNELDHAACENKYCLATESVTACVAAANKLKTMVLAKLNLNETELLTND